MDPPIPANADVPPVRSRSKKRCRQCRRLFVPDPRTAGWQHTCSRPDCQRARHAASHRRWVADNPGCYRGRYADTKAWLATHPGYLRAWRKSWRDIQDEITTFSSLFPPSYVDIPPLIYKTGWIVAAQSVFWPP